MQTKNKLIYFCFSFFNTVKRTSEHANAPIYEKPALTTDNFNEATSSKTSPSSSSSSASSAPANTNSNVNSHSYNQPKFGLHKRGVDTDMMMNPLHLRDDMMLLKPNSLPYGLWKDVESYNPDEIDADDQYKGRKKLFYFIFIFQLIIDVSFTCFIFTFPFLLYFLSKNLQYHTIIHTT